MQRCVPDHKIEDYVDSRLRDMEPHVKHFTFGSSVDSVGSWGLSSFDQRDEFATLQLIELHPLPPSQNHSVVGLTAVQDFILAYVRDGS